VVADGETHHFKPSGEPMGNSFDKMTRNFELQCNKEFTCMFAPTTQEPEHKEHER
jgi:hypothetical protein